MQERAEKFRSNERGDSRNLVLKAMPKARSLSCDAVLNRLHGDDDAEVEAEPEPPGSAWPQPAVQGHHIQVAVRCRPLHPQESQAGGRAIINVIDGQTVVLEDPQTVAADDYLRINKSKERRYTFDEAFNEVTATADVHDRTARFLISGVLQGFNATVFAYGATGAGKTHTMLGNLSEPGIMMLTLLDLFNEVSVQREERRFEVKCSFLEVYNEQVRDLLRPEADYLDIREDPVKGMCVAGISEVGGLESAREIMTLLHQGNKHRTTEATGANVTSSRSHAVLQVVVEQRDKTADIVAHVNLGKLSMIDLAGSERASQTNNKGLRMIEGANINRSLLALGNCITALSSAVSFVPYRDSKMTRLLKDSLGGNCRTVMIANVSPCHLNYEDTHNTLKYASRAKNIKTKAVRNIVRVNCHVSKYTEIIKELQGEITDLKAKLATAPESIPTSPSSLQQLPEMSRMSTADLQRVPTSNAFASEASEPLDMEDLEAMHAQSAKWKQELMQNFEERVKIKRQLIDLAHEAKNQMVQKSHAQVGISQWESAQVKGGQNMGGSAPAPIQDLQEKLQTIKVEMGRTEETTKGLEAQLEENQRQAQKLHAELPQRVQNKDMRAFLGLVSRIYVMEVENMDLQEMNDVTAPLIQQKDLEAEALRLQIQMRDRMIEEQNGLLAMEGRPTAEKPEGWVEISALPARPWQEEAAAPASPSRRARLPSFVESPDRRGDRSPSRYREATRANSQPPSSRADVVLPPLSPTRRGQYAARVPPRSCNSANGGRGNSSSRMESRDRLPAVEGHNAYAADRRGRGYMHMNQGGMSPAQVYGAKPEVYNSNCPRPLGSYGHNGHSYSHQRRGRKKKNRRSEVAGRAMREKERQQERQQEPQRPQHQQLHVEASSLHKERDDGSQGSSCERGRSPGPGGSVLTDVAVTRNTVEQRRGIIDKLNRRMKPG